VYGVRLSKSYSLSLALVIFWIRDREFFSFSLIRNPVRSLSPVLFGSAQDILAVLDLMFVTVRVVGLSGNRARKKGIIVK
jgi:hypothetical protein